MVQECRAARTQGIGPGFVPEVLNTRAYDEIILVSDTDAMAGSRKLASGEGILAGISSGANFHAALEVAQRPANRGKTIVFMVVPSTAQGDGRKKRGKMRRVKDRC